MRRKDASGRDQQDYADDSGRAGSGPVSRKFPFHLIGIAVAIVISGMLLCFGYQSVEAEMVDRPWDVVAVGDSIIGKEREDGTVDSYFEEYSGLTMVNGAFGGNCASAGDDADRYSYNEEAINLCNLAKAIAYRDFGVQWADLAASQMKLEYFNEAMKKLASVDFGQTKVLLLAFGTNDYLSGKKPDDSDDPFNQKAYGGALRYAIELLRKTYPALKIVLVTPPYCHISGWEGCYTQKFYSGGTLDQYVEVEKQVAAQYGLYVIDVFGELGIDESNYETYMEPGGLHLNHAGRELYARFLAEEVKKILEEKSK